MKRTLAILALSLLALPAAAERLAISPDGPRSLPRGAWVADGPTLSAPEHPLAPRLSVGPGAVLSVTLPGGESLRMVPAGITTRTARPLSLPLAEPVLHLGQSPSGLLVPEAAFVSDSWIGVDESFLLLDGQVKHDLVVHADALSILGRGDLAASWLLELPSGVRAVMAEDGGVDLERGNEFVARIPPALIADADDEHWTARQARFEVQGLEGSPLLTLVVPESWAFDPARAFPLRLDPTLSLHPTGNDKTGFVDELGNRSDGAIDSGSLADVGFGFDVRGYAQFDTSSIPDAAAISEVRLQVWLSNHDNPFDAAVPLRMEVKHVPVLVSTLEPILWANIGGLGAGTIYASENLPRTGAEFCPDAYVFRDYDLGPAAVTNLSTQLPSDFFTVGFVSEIVTDPFFDHIDYIGFPEQVLNFGCPTIDFPGTRITLVVTFESNRPPTCSAGGPYVSDCPIGPIALDGSASSDPDGDPLTYAWTTDCPGSIANADQPLATLNLDGGCLVECNVTLEVGDGTELVSCTSTVSAQDLTPPEIVSSDLVELCLWPPRHDMFFVGPAAGHVVAVDSCQPFVNVTWTACASDQPDEAREDGRPENGDGHFADDCQVDADGNLWVRVERAGSDPVDGRNTFEGRRYAVAVAADDGCGNVVTLPGTLRVPHDRRGGSGGQDDPCLSGSKRK